MNGETGAEIYVESHHLRYDEYAKRHSEGGSLSSAITYMHDLIVREREKQAALNPLTNRDADSGTDPED